MRLIPVHLQSVGLADRVLLILRRFLAHGMPVYAGALAFRGILALVPLALFLLALVGLFIFGRHPDLGC